ncbi:MAG: FMN-binding negative transcriptional regulator [Azospirillaceae bacterium]|nr:FMN-binding negative transcriptional regulator [Azospirillaceae bacterium]
MYLPPAFHEQRIPVLHDIIQQTGLPTLVTLGENGLAATPVPMLLDREPGPLGRLRGHLARANPQARVLGREIEALALFAGPDAYITPSWYAAKQETGKVVPTWNYVAVHAYGRVTMFDDAERLLALVTALTERHEAGRSQPWVVGDAPADFIESMLRGIIGFELTISRLEGKSKLSQNRSPWDRAAVAAGLVAEGKPGPAAVGALIAAGEEGGGEPGSTGAK